MSSTQLVRDSNADSNASYPVSEKFDSQLWLNYFEDNRKAKPSIKLTERIVLGAAIEKPLIRSLQRFQIGETGDGRHLKKFAKRIGDPVYVQCVDMFIKEEQGHAQILAEVILAMNGTLLSWHWTDIAFIGLRRLLGLKMEILILLIAEVIGKCFYKAIADQIQHPLLRDIFSLIVFDEIAHLEFHSEFLHSRLKSFPKPFRFFVHSIWCVLFYAACLVFVLDHKASLKALHLTKRQFLEQCSIVFQRAAAHSLAL